MLLDVKDKKDHQELQWRTSDAGRKAMPELSLRCSPESGAEPQIFTWTATAAVWGSPDAVIMTVQIEPHSPTA